MNTLVVSIERNEANRQVGKTKKGHFSVAT